MPKCAIPGCFEERVWEPNPLDPGEDRERRYCPQHCDRLAAECLAAYKARKSEDYNVIRVDFPGKKKIS